VCVECAGSRVSSRLFSLSLTHSLSLYLSLTFSLTHTDPAGASASIDGCVYAYARGAPRTTRLITSRSCVSHLSCSCCAVSRTTGVCVAAGAAHWPRVVGFVTSQVCVCVCVCLFVCVCVCVLCVCVLCVLEYVGVCSHCST